MKIGIIGCGNIANAHAAIITRNVGRHKLLFCDVNEKRANELASRYCPGPTYRTIDELLEAERLDAAHILTPPLQRGIVVEKALAAGVNVYVEKPVAESVSEYVRLQDVARKRNVLLCAGYSTLGIPAMRKARILMNSGRYGKLITVHCDFNWSVHEHPIPYGRAEHWAYSLRGGVLQNLVDHPASVIVDALDEFQTHQSVFGHRNKLPNGCADLMHISVSNDHQLGSFTVSMGHGNTRGHVAYSLEGATIMVDLRRELLAIIDDSSSLNRIRRAASGVKLSWELASGVIENAWARATGSLSQESGILGLVRNFYGAIAGREGLLVGETTVTRILGLLEQVWEEIPGDFARVS